MRILYHHRTQGRGAEGNHIVSIVTALRGLGHEVQVLSPPGVDPFDPARSVPVDKSRTTTRGWERIWKWMSRHLPNWAFELAELAFNVPAYLRLRRTLSGGRFDLVYERYAFFLLAGALASRKAGCRFLLEANEVSGVPLRARPQSFVRLCAFLERLLIRRSTCVHAVSSYLGERLISRGLEPERLVVMPNGFDRSRLQIYTSRREVRERLGISDSLVIGFAGWFDRWDRLEFLAEVFAVVHAARPHVRLCLIGAGPGLDELRSVVASRGVADAVVLTGAVERANVYDHLQVFDIGILPHSNPFGSPIVMFEMMALGIPLVLPRLPPILDVHGGEATAVLFDPLDSGQCAAALLRLVDSVELRESLAHRAGELLDSKYTWATVAEAIMGRLATTEPLPVAG